ncbi:MAG: RIP metalloprotease RseP [Bradymonadia bacterium]
MITLLATVVLLGVLITIHEFGHYIVAKLSNVRVRVFSIGMGPTLVSWTRGETEYRISKLPVGGYVRLAGAEPGEAPEPEEVGRTLQDKPPWIRILIYLGGPVMNLVLPFIILVPLFSLSGKYDQVEGNVVGALDTGRPAYQEGLREGDAIIEIDGESVSTFWQVVKHVDEYSADQGPMRLKVERPGVAEPIALEIHPEEINYTDVMGFEHKQYRIGYSARFKSPTISIVDPEKGGGQAGLTTFDRIVKVGDREIDHYVTLMSALIQAPADAPLVLEVERATPLKASGLQLESLFAKKKVQITLPPSTAARTPESLGLGAVETCVTTVDAGGPAAKAPAVGHSAGPGLKPGDCITAIDGKALSLWYSMYARLTHQPQQAKKLTVRRNGQLLDFTLALEQVKFEDPLAGEIKQWRMGLSWLPDQARQVKGAPVDNVDRLGYAWYEANRMVERQVTNTVRSIGGMFSGQVSPQQLSGPITIGYLAGEYAKAGFESFLHLMVVVSLSLALINLMPIPALDGGHILVASIEMIIRRPLPIKVQQGIQVVGGVMLIGLIFFALGNDLLKQFRLWSG